MYLFYRLIVVFFIAVGCNSINAPHSLGGKIRSEQLSIEVSEGFIEGFIDRKSGKNYCPTGQKGPVLTVHCKGKKFTPSSMTWLNSGNLLQLIYADAGVTAKVSVQAKASHIVLELIEISPEDEIAWVMWGPYPTTIGKTIGETIGVVRDDQFAVGIQALNVKTLGGYPDGDDDVMPSYSIFDNNNYKDISLEFKDKHLYRGNTAVASETGSRLQAYCRNRSKDRLIENWGNEKFVAPAFMDGGVIGSKIALFGCPAKQALETIGKIELAEGLPHPILNGEWAKTSYESTASYIIMDFSEHNIEKAIEVTHQAGLKWLYHSSPFATWGHFELRKNDFPNGWAGFKACVDRARKSGIGIGFHTLSNFTTPNDAYVTPVPDPRLAKIGSSRITKEITAADDSIGIESPDFFKKKTTLNTVMVGNELIQYQNVSESAPWKLLGCIRGAFGTKAAAHNSGDSIGKLMDHGYKVFLTNAELSIEQAERIAEFCNFTGARQLSFDGLEGNWSTGMGQYGRSIFTKAWYDKLNQELQGQVINDASNPGHYNWHTYTRMNWGEPWYAGFRESQTLYRLKNQYYYSRNLMPRMLGWFALGGNTSVEDAEWLLARAAGFDAGFSLATSLKFAGDQIVDPSKAVNDNGPQNNLQAILQAIREWEEARMAGVFPEKLKNDLQDISKEFHLDKVNSSQWNLFPVYSIKFQASSQKQSFEIDNPHATQSLQFIIQNNGPHPVQELSLNGVTVLEGELNPGEIVKYRNNIAVFYNQNWEQLRSLQREAEAIKVKQGKQTVTLGWRNARDGCQLNIELRTLGKAKRLDNN